MTSLREWAQKYRRLGFAIVPIRRGQKRPTQKGWNRKSFEPDDFAQGDNIGIQSGRLSGDLVCVDIDSRKALELADKYLPPRGMVEGRPNKRRSHRWYRVINIPAELTAPASVAGGFGGPSTRRFRTPAKNVIIEFHGTGTQAVVPPSLWTNQSGDQQEHREWDIFEEPATIDCQELFDSVTRLAVACGHRPKPTVQPTGKRQGTVATAERLPLPTGEVARQARAYVAKMDPAIAGHGGDQQTYNVACTLVIDFDLSPEKALPILCEYNLRCCPPWTMQELRHKLSSSR
jgi:hypothetical protein